MDLNDGSGERCANTPGDRVSRRSTRPRWYPGRRLKLLLPHAKQAKARPRWQGGGHFEPRTKPTVGVDFEVGRGTVNVMDGPFSHTMPGT